MKRSAAAGGRELGTLCALGLVMICSLPIAASQPALRVYGIDDGLNFPQVFTLAQDRLGMVWVGTSFGVGRYDGQGFTRLTRTGGLPHETVFNLAEGTDGTMWVATQEGTVAVGPAGSWPGRLARRTDVAGVLDRVVPATRVVTAGDVVWFAHGGRVSRLQGGAIESWSVPGDGEVRSLGPASDDSVWFVSDAGVARFRVDHGFDALAAPTDLGQPVTVIDRDGGPWLVLQGGLASLVGDRFVTDRRYQLAVGMEATCATSFGSGVVIGTAADGAWVDFGSGELTQLDSRHGMPSNTIYDVMSDRDGLLWLGTANGLVKISDFGVRSFPSAPPTVGSMVLAVTAGDDGQVWLGHAEGTSVIEEDGRVVIQPAGGGRTGEPGAWAILVLGRDEALVGTRSGIVAVDHGRARRVTELPSPGQSRIFDLVLDDDTIWASTAGGVIGFRWDHELHRAANSIPVTRIGDRPVGEARGLAVAGDGVIWVGTDGSGVVRIEAGPDGRPVLVERLGADDGLPPSLVCRAVLIHNGDVLVGCDAGLYRLGDEERFSVVAGVNSALEDPYVVALADDGDGRLFVAHPFGVVEVMDDRIVRRFDRSTGLAGAMTTAENCLVVDAGRLWIGMVGGVTSVDVDRPVAPSTPPEVVLFDARTEDGRSVTPDEVLPWQRRTVFFIYRSPTYVAEQRTLFSERLVGLDDRWSEPHRRPERRYTNLSPGPYQLLVRAIASDGTVGPETAVLDFSVVPPWWQTLPARVAAFMVLAALGWLASAWRIRAIRQSNRELEDLVRQRTLALEQANRELDALARMDSLTGLANRRVFAESLDQEWRRAARRREELAVILVDIDHFKAYNDALGHPAGDACLRRVATAIGACATRPQDLAARYGGEEFAVLLPATDLAGAQRVAERCRRQIEDLRISHPASPVAAVVTCSLGVAAAAADDDVDSADVVGLADAALYRAKAAGRNRVA